MVDAETRQKHNKKANSQVNGSPHRAANEALIDDRFMRFKKEILDKLDQNHKAYINGNLHVSIVNGHVQHAYQSTEEDGVTITDRFKRQGHIPT